MKYQIMPDLTLDEYEDLKMDIKVRGVMVPIEFDEFGEILDGHHRLRACDELGISDYPKVIRAGMTEPEKRFHARKLNVARRQLTQETRRELICAQLKETPEISDRQIAAGLGVSDKTVGTVRKELESIAEIPQCSRQTADGREYPAQRKPPVSRFNPTPAETQSLKEHGNLIAKNLETGAASDFTDARYKAIVEAHDSKPPAPKVEVDPVDRSYRRCKAIDNALSGIARLDPQDSDYDCWREFMLGGGEIEDKIRDIAFAMNNLMRLRGFLVRMRSDKTMKWSI